MAVKTMENTLRKKMLKRGDVSYKSISWKPGTINRVEGEDLLTILKEGYNKNKASKPTNGGFIGKMSEFAFSLDMADLDGVVQSSSGHNEELCERDPLGCLDPAFGSYYSGQFILFTNTLNQRIRSQKYLTNNDLEQIMETIQPDRTKPFRRRIYQHLCDKDKDGYIAIWPEVTKILDSKGITVSVDSPFKPYLVSTFLSASIGIHQFNKIDETRSNSFNNSNLIYYKPWADFCQVEHYYGIRAVGIENKEIKALDISPTQIVEPKDIWKFAQVQDSFEVFNKTYKRNDLPKLIYPEEIHKDLGL
jgi:hypothetical protein